MTTHDTDSRPVNIRVRPVGQSFGLRGYLMRGSTIVASTDVVPFGFEQTAWDRAETLAARMGLAVRNSREERS